MALVCQDPDHIIQHPSAAGHARLTFPIPPHQFGVSRGNALGRGCRGGGLPLPPPAQGMRSSHKGSFYSIENEGRTTAPAAARAGHPLIARTKRFSKVKRHPCRRRVGHLHNASATAQPGTCYNRAVRFTMQRQWRTSSRALPCLKSSFFVLRYREHRLTIA
jgi:hypothetical protein